MTREVRTAADRLRALIGTLPESVRTGSWHNPEPFDGWNCLVSAGVYKLGTFSSKPLAQYVATVASPEFVEAVADLLAAIGRADCEDDDCLAVLGCAEVLADRLGAA